MTLIHGAGGVRARKLVNGRARWGFSFAADVTFNNSQEAEATSVADVKPGGMDSTFAENLVSEFEDGQDKEDNLGKLVAAGCVSEKPLADLSTHAEKLWCAEIDLAGETSMVDNDSPSMRKGVSACHADIMITGSTLGTAPDQRPRP